MLIQFALLVGLYRFAHAVESWDAFVPPADSKFDWIQLDSGEWLKGDLKGMYNESLEFDSDKMDLQEFDFDDVIRMRTRNAQRVLMQKKGDEEKIYTGMLQMHKDKVELLQGDRTMEFPRDEVVAIAQKTERERDNWSGNLSIGMNARGGNSDTIDAYVSGSLKRQTARTRYNVDYRSNYSGTRDQETANNQRLKIDSNIFLSYRLYWRFVEAEFYRDKFSNIDRQFSIQSGLGYYLFRTPKTEWAFGAGLGFQRTKYYSVEPGEEDVSESPYLAAGTELDYQITSTVDYLLDYSFRLLNESNGSYTHHLVTTFSLDLIVDMDLDVSLVWDRVQDPTPNADGELPDQNDYQLIFSLAYDF